MPGLIRRLRNAITLAAADEPAAKAAPEIVFVSEGQVPGWLRTFRKSEQVYRRFQIERARFAGYRDDWVATEESPIVERSILKLAEDSTAQFFDIECDDRRALQGMWACLDRTRYWYLRKQLLFRLIATGDVFLLVDLNVMPSRKRNLAEIAGLRVPAEYQMFRMEDERGIVRDSRRAFMQMPGIDWIVDESGKSVMLQGENTLLMGGGGWYEGLVGAASKKRLYAYTDEIVYFPAESVIHGRLNPLIKPIYDGYGCSGQRSTRVTHNIVQMALQDLAIARHQTTYNREHHKLPAMTSKDAYEEYKKALDEQEVGPTSRYVTIDGEISTIDARNWQLTELADLKLNIQMLQLGIGYPLCLTGFLAEDYTGELLARLEQPLDATLGAINLTEEYALIRPLLDRELWYMGKAGTAYELRWPKTRRPEDVNKKSKRVISEVQANILSVRAAMRELYQFEPNEQNKMVLEIVEERAKGIAPGHYQAGPENLNKGKKGVTKKDSSGQDIADAYDRSDE